MRQLAFENDVSITTLYLIKKEMDKHVPKLRLEKPITNRNIVNSSIIQRVISTYLADNRIPLTTKDISSHIKEKVRLAVPESTIRIILTKMLNLKYKKGLARPVDFDEGRQKLIKLWLSIKV